MTAFDSSSLTSELPIEAIPTLPTGRTWGERLAPFLSNKLAVLGAILTVFFLVVACIGAAIMFVP